MLTPLTNHQDVAMPARGKTRVLGRSVNNRSQSYTKRVQHSREDRHLARSKLGTLRSLITSPKTQKRYEVAVTRLFDFLELEDKDFTSSALALDDALSDFIEMLWQDGDPRFWAEDAVSGLQKFIPSLRGHFRQSWSLVKAWQKFELPQRCTPFSLQVFRAFLGAALRQRRKAFALTVAVGFHCILRTSEMWGLVQSHFQFSNSGDKAILSLPDTKSGSRFHFTESVTLSDPLLIRRLKDFFADRLPGDPIYAGNLHKFRSDFNAVLASLPLPRHLLYKPYSIRRGAATEDFRRHGLIGRTCTRGRWSNEKTCRIYINEGMLDSTHVHLSKIQSNLLEELAAEAMEWFSK